MMSYNTTRRKAISYEQTNLLIKLVKKNPGIWNHDDPKYNDRGATSNAWKAIAQQMQLEEEFIRTKWKSLRDLFIRELKRLKGPNIDPEKGRWRHFKKLWFLYRPGYWENKIRQEDNTSEAVEENPTTETYEVKIEPDPINEFVFLDEEEEEEEKEELGKRIFVENPRVDPVDVKENMFLEQEPDYKRRRMDIYTEEDCDMMFFKSLMPYFKSLPPIRKLMLRNRIQEMLLTEIAKETGNGPIE